MTNQTQKKSMSKTKKTVLAAGTAVVLAGGAGISGKLPSSFQKLFDSLTVSVSSSDQNSTGNVKQGANSNNMAGATFKATGEGKIQVGNNTDSHDNNATENSGGN